MAYYMGDYYQGDYYQGDPAGPLVGLAVAGGRKLLGRVIPGAAKKLFGRPRVAAAAATGMAIATRAVTAMKPRAATAPPSMQGPTIPIPRGGMQLPPPGGFTGPAPVGGVRGKVQRFLPGGATGYEWRRRKRINVANVKALRRAIRRAEGFRKLAMRVLSFSKGKSFGGRVVKFKRKGR